jgi:hypothetical protein
MTSTRFVFLAVLLMGFAAFAHADGVDPKIIISDPPCSGEGCPSPVFAGQGFQFAVVNGGGIFTGTNESGVTWTSLDFVLSGTAVLASSINCSAPGLYTCFVNSNEGGDATNILYDSLCDGCTGTGIPNNEQFFVNLNDTGSTTGSWPVDEMFTGSYNNTSPTIFTPLTPVSPVPEPSTIALVGTGLAALIAKRKRQARSSALSSPV